MLLRMNRKDEIEGTGSFDLREDEHKLDQLQTTSAGDIVFCSDMNDAMLGK